MPRPAPDADDDDQPPRPKRKPPEADDQSEAVEPARRPRPRREDEDDPRRARRRHEEEDDDDEENAPRARRRPRDEEDDDEEDRPRRSRRKDALARLIPYHNPMALAAYYCGVFSLIPVLGNLLGPIAFVLGILGIYSSQRHKKAGGIGHAIAGLILGLVTSLFYWWAAYRYGAAILEAMGRR